MNIAVIIKQILPHSEEGSRDLEVEFDRGRQRFIQHQTVLIVDKKTPAAQQKVQALHGNIEAAAAAGIGNLQRQRILSTYDGSQLATYRESGGAYILNPDEGQVHFCFDPRILGISRSHTIDYKLGRCLGLDDGGVPSLVGAESAGGRVAWHVKVSYPKTQVDYHFWVEDTAGFRVLRYEYKHPSDGSLIHLVAQSHYGDARERPILPTRVELTETHGKQWRSEILFTATKVDYGAKPDPAVFGLKGLDMPVGTGVIDERIHRSVGYWTGEGLSPDYIEAKASGVRIAAAAAVIDRTRRTWWLAALTVTALVGLVGSIVGYRRLARRRTEQ